MRHIKLNIRLVTFLAAVVVAVVAAGSLAPGPRQAYADYTDPTGIFCTDATPFGVDGIILIRFDLNFDPDDGNPNDVAMSTVAYVPELSATCQDPQSPITAELVPQTGNRPTFTADWNPVTHTITGESCAEDADFGIVLPGWTRFVINFQFNSDPSVKSQSPTSFEIHTLQIPGGDPEGEVGDTTCTDDDPPNVTQVIPVPTNGKYLDGPGGDPATFDSDWDKDGCTDWDELNPNGSLLDPFNSADCAPGVGGIAELPAVAGTALEAGSSDRNAGVIAAAAAATAAGALALSSVAWYARRRVR